MITAESILKDNATSLEFQAKVKKNYLEFIQNKDIPLKERWELFTVLGMYHGDTGSDTRSAHFGCLSRIWTDWKSEWVSEWAELERYETLVFVDFIDDSIHNLTYLQTLAPEKVSSTTLKIMEVDYDEWKEDILQKNIWSFKYDW